MRQKHTRITANRPITALEDEAVDPRVLRAARLHLEPPGPTSRVREGETQHHQNSQAHSETLSPLGLVHRLSKRRGSLASGPGSPAPSQAARHHPKPPGLTQEPNQLIFDLHVPK
ncbi:hypothetical protein U9M48_024023 [Paspalum notatum var. saurae]|uniref:Uncharacterized protein n=1 Tax=Paspalum notatum var. saurae TaxID=547442 RepID=A0AAQ3WV91_PASNO